MVDCNQQWRWPPPLPDLEKELGGEVGIGSVAQKWHWPQSRPNPCHRGLPIMNRQMTQRSDVKVFLSLDGDVTIQQRNNIVTLDQHQLKHVIELLQIAQSAVPASATLFQSA